MTKSQIEDFFIDWPNGYTYIFEYKRYIVPSEYVSFKKDGDQLLFQSDDSTYQMKSMPKTEFSKFLSSGELIHTKTAGWGRSALNMKTGNCNCGAWVLSDNKYLHNDQCPLYLNPHKQRSE